MSQGISKDVKEFVFCWLSAAGHGVSLKCGLYTPHRGYFFLYKQLSIGDWFWVKGTCPLSLMSPGTDLT